MNRYEEFEEIQTAWTPPRELAGSLPREVRLSGQGKFVVALAVLLLAGAIAATAGFSVMSGRQARRRDLLLKAGQTTTAAVTRRWQQSSGEDVRHMIAYQFSWNGSTYTGRSAVPSRLWKTWDKGALLDVTFLPSNPARNRPAAVRDAVMPIWIPPIIGLFLAGTSALIFFSTRRDARVLSEGRPAPAIVTRHSRSENGKVAHYEFRLLSGAIAKGKTQPKRKPPATGTVICVLYDRDNPRLNRAYPLATVRL
jgi:hypothetical protein